MTKSNLLKDRFPELADQMVDQELAKTITAGSSARPEWQCDKGDHTWRSRISDRCNGNGQCTVCKSISMTHPDLAAELVDQSLAKTLRHGMAKKVEWRCKEGHTWFASVHSRSRGYSTCPTCKSLSTTHPDVAAKLVDQSLATVLTYGTERTAQWYCEHGHIWEGPVYLLTQYYPVERCLVCSGEELSVGVNDLATVSPQAASNLVDPHLATQHTFASTAPVDWRCPLGHEWNESITDQLDVSGCPVCTGRVLLPGFNDINTVAPELVPELADPSHSTQYTLGRSRIEYPDWLESRQHFKAEIGSGYMRSDHALYWICDEGHEETGSAKDRLERLHHFGSGCATCNNFAVTHPHLSSWSFTRDPQDFTALHKLDRSWRCPVGHIWLESPRDLANRDNCPFCSGEITLVPGENDLWTTHRMLATQLSDIYLSTEIMYSSVEPVEWVCWRGHHWTESPSNVVTGAKCPHCKGVSLVEGSLREMVEGLYPGHVIFGDRRWLKNGQELDILIPAKRVAIELNGMYWHSMKVKEETTYHADKTGLAQQNDLSLIHIWEDDWDEAYPLVLRLIAQRLGVTEQLGDVAMFDSPKAAQVIPASELAFAQIGDDEATRFFEKNSLLPQPLGTHHFGLLDGDGETRAVISLSETARPGQWQMTNLVTLGEINGALEALMVGSESALKEIGEKAVTGWEVTTPNDYTDDSIYKAAGFEPTRYLDPTPWYHLGSVTPRRVLSLEELGDRSDDPNVLTVYDSGSSVWEKRR